MIDSTAAWLPEVYGNSAHYIDPHNYDVDLDELLKEPIAPASEVLDKYSWAKEATKVFGFIEKMKNQTDFSIKNINIYL